MGFVPLLEPAGVFAYHNLWTAGDNPFIFSFWKLCCLQLQASRNLQRPSSSSTLILWSCEQLYVVPPVQRWLYSTWDNVCAVFYLQLLGKKISNPSNSKMEILKLFITIGSVLSFSSHYAECKQNQRLLCSFPLCCVWGGRAVVCSKGNWIAAASDFQVLLVTSCCLHVLRTL